LVDVASTISPNSFEQSYPSVSNAMTLRTTSRFRFGSRSTAGSRSSALRSLISPRLSWK